MAIKLNLDGAYIPSFNKSSKHLAFSLKKNFCIIGSAHNLKEIRIKENQKVEKILQIYGRSFDQIKQFIDSLAYMNSVNYNPENDIPSQLLVNLAQTLGWSSNFSPITNEDFLKQLCNEVTDQFIHSIMRCTTIPKLKCYYRCFAKY